MSVVYYVPTDDDELLVSTMAGRSKAIAVARDPKVSLCVLDERWPFTYLQVYADATVDPDPELVGMHRPRLVLRRRRRRRATLRRRGGPGSD
jgi:hypothetical protein